MKAAPVRAAVFTSMLAAVVLVGMVASAAAQVRPPPKPLPGPAPRAGSWEIGGGALLAGGFDLGSSPALLTPNIGTPSPFQLFVTDSRFESATGLQMRLGRYLSRRIALEGGVRYARPLLSMSLTGDVEGAPSITASSTLHQYLIDGSLVLHFPRAAFSRGRGVPFISGGAGYLRELSPGNELVETGREYHAGGGVKVWFGASRRRFGIRGEAGLSKRDRGFDFEEGIRTVPTAGASLIYLF